MSGLVGGDGLVTKRPFLLHIYVLLTLLGHRWVMNKQIYPPWGSICTKQLFFMFQMSLSSILQVHTLIFSLISKAPSVVLPQSRTNLCQLHKPVKGQNWQICQFILQKISIIKLFCHEEKVLNFLCDGPFVVHKYFVYFQVQPKCGGDKICWFVVEPKEFLSAKYRWPEPAQRGGGDQVDQKQHGG